MAFYYEYMNSRSIYQDPPGLPRKPGTSDPDSVYKELKAQIQSLKRRRPRPYYRAAFQLAREISDIGEATRRYLLSSAPEMGWEIIDLLMRSDKKLLYSVDDSSGAVGDEFSYLPELWIEFAGRCGQDEKFWLKKIERLIKEDEWGFRGEVLEQSANLLSKPILKKLADKFEEQTKLAKERLTPGGSYTQQCPVWHNASLWMSCAKALVDPFMYEKAVTVKYSRKPAGQQLLGVIRIFIKTKHYEEAEDRLGRLKNTNFESQRMKLLAEIYKETGNKEKLLKLAKTRFQQFPARENLKSLLQIIPASEHAGIKKQAVKFAIADTQTLRAVPLLLELGRIDAAEKMLIERQAKITESAYPMALHLIDHLQKHDSVMGIVICNRALLLDILNRGFYKGYRHAENYFKTLRQLNNSGIAYPQGMDNHETFVKSLKKKHGLKSSFWKRVEK